MKQDIIRPIFGTIMLQPFALLWAYTTRVNYWASFGPFTVFSTIYLIPIYAIYEAYWRNKRC